MARRAEVEGLLAVAQKECRILSEKLLQNSSSAKHAEDKKQRMEVAIEVAKASEQRLISQLTELREETRRQVALSESMLRIEAGLASRSEEEKNSLVHERDALVKTVEGLRKEIADSSLLSDQRSRSLEEELRSARIR